MYTEISKSPLYCQSFEFIIRNGPDVRRDIKRLDGRDQ